MRTLSVVIPCYNEEATLARCVERVLAIADSELCLEVIIVDDCSRDASRSVGRELAARHPQVRLLTHDKNQGKGAALRTGFAQAAGDFVAVQDADLEYDPRDLKLLVGPLAEGRADVVLGSRFLACGAHRVLYFWHAMGNKLLTFLSNMFTDLNLTDMETCYKVFRREILQQIEIRENRFGFEPEIVAKVAALRVRVYEMGISYAGRTYAEGKKIGAKDGLRALYCIFRYNAHRAPLPVQFMIYLAIGAAAAAFNLAVFLALAATGAPVNLAAPAAFAAAALANYLLCIALLFRHRARWSAGGEILIYWAGVAALGVLDLLATRLFLDVGLGPPAAKLCASIIGLIFNFGLRRFLVFPEPPAGPWSPQDKHGVKP